MGHATGPLAHHFITPWLAIHDRRYLWDENYAPLVPEHATAQTAGERQRVLVEASGDLFDDEPRPGEAVHVYRRVGEPRQFHVLMSPRRLSGWRLVADYAYLAEQPPAECVRETGAWRAWCVAEQARERAAVVA